MAPNNPTKNSPSKEYELKKSLLLLATLVATVTYASGLNLPGGTWQDTQGGHLAGDPILRDTHYHQYSAFYYCNAAAFAASLVVSLLLLFLKKEREREGRWLTLLRGVMVLDLLGLMAAYAAGSSRDAFTTICSSLLVSVVFAAYVVVVVIASPSPGEPTQKNEDKEQRELLMLLAIFAVTITYVAGLNPPGGFWRNTQDGHVVVGDPVLKDRHPSRYKAFFFCNTTAFVASLLIIIQLLDSKLSISGGKSVRLVLLYGYIAIALFSLVGAYAAGSFRDTDNTVSVLGLGGALLLAFIFLQVCLRNIKDFFGKHIGSGSLQKIRDFFYKHIGSSRLQKIRDLFSRKDGRYDLGKAREFVQLLAILVATITYQAGLDPPGGLWPDNREGHQVGDPILLTTHPVRYKVFFYSNSAAFVASLIIVIMLQSEFLVMGHTLEAAMVLDLFSLIAAYAVGSCRQTSTSIYIVAIAGAVLIYVVIHIVFLTLDQTKGTSDDILEKRREVLLLLAVLAATLTYQAGLTPPGGFWEEDDKFGHHAGDPVLLDNYPRRYTAFFYCNAASFMASVALIVLLVNQNLYKPGIRCYALIVCMVAGMFGLMGAYAAGSSRHLRTSIYVLTLVVAVFVFVVCLGALFLRKRDGDKTDTPKEPPESEDMPKYLMLLGILAASVAYLTGLKPPGGTWKDDGNGHTAGSPILYDINKRRYNAFFYTNSTAFMASIAVIVLLLRRMLYRLRDSQSQAPLPLWPMHTAILLGVTGLLGAYAVGSARDWGTSWNIVALLGPMLAFIAFCAAVQIFIFFRRNKDPPSGGNP